MARAILVCGPSGAGKTTYARSVARDLGAVRFSIDPWMQTLYAADMTSLDFSWILERVNRCHEQIWDTCAQILKLDGNVVLDLGFSTKAQRAWFADKLSALGLSAEVHYLDAPRGIRKDRIVKRNHDKDPAVYAFEVTEGMFDFMEPRFEPPNPDELRHGHRLNTG
ncbi:MAG: ATP-binding protein [Pseudomonadota bacterium]